MSALFAVATEGSGLSTKGQMWLRRVMVTVMVAAHRQYVSEPCDSSGRSDKSRQARRLPSSQPSTHERRDAHSVTSTFLKAAVAGSLRASMRPASSSERGAHRLA